MSNDSWQQHYPTYSYQNRDVVLEEYKSSSRIFESEERLFNNASAIVSLSSSFIGLSFAWVISTFKSTQFDIEKLLSISVFSFFILYFLCIMFVKYITHRQKAYVFAARKVVVLRRMLNLDYGAMRSVLPIWRFEGATSPFSIKLFPGWFSYSMFPLYIISSVAICCFYYVPLIFDIFTKGEFHFFGLSELVYFVLCFICIFILIVLYRRELLDTHESLYLLFVKLLSSTICLSLVNNFEYVIYRSVLSTYEVKRLGVNTGSLMKAVVFIEDKSFYSHYGVSLRGTARALKSIFGLCKRSGGSTVTQQVARTLFIKDYSKTYRRKLVEILLAFWYDKKFSKRDQMHIYLASVVYDGKANGILNAMKYYFGDKIQNPSAAQSFFLVERISNMRSRLLFSRIKVLVNAMVEEGLMTDRDVDELGAIYKEMILSGKVIDNEGMIDEWIGVR